jgi:hypothetical protein
MEVSGQLYAPAALVPGKEHAVPTGKVGWASQPVLTLLRKKIASTGNRTPAVQPVACRYTDPRSVKICVYSYLDKAKM